MWATSPGRPGDPVVWNTVFIADVTPPEERKKGIGAKADGPLITVAAPRSPTSDPKNNRIQLDMRNYSTHEMGKDGLARDEAAPIKTIALDAKPPEQKQLASSAMNTRQLLRYHGPDWIDVGVELHRRFALPVEARAASAAR